MNRNWQVCPVLLGAADVSMETIGALEGTAHGWVKVVGLTLGDTNHPVSGAGWWEGSGSWDDQNGTHPAPLSLQVLVLVRSSEWPSERVPLWLQGHGAIVQRTFDLSAVCSHVIEVLHEIGCADWDVVVSRLRMHFYVDELDEP